MGTPTSELISLQWSATSGGTYATLGAIIDIDMAEAKTKEIDDSGLNDLVDLTLPGAVTPGEMKVVLKYDKAVVTQLKTWQDAGTIVFLRAKMGATSAAGQRTHSGFVLSYKVTNGRGKTLQIEATFKLDGGTDAWVTT